LLEDLVCLVRLANVAARLVDRLQAGAHPDRNGEEHERDSAEDRGLAVLCAPAAHAGREVV
jgi:hypothetical protein